MKNYHLLLSLLILFISCKDDPEIPREEVLNAELNRVLLEASAGQGKSYFRLPDSHELVQIPQDSKNPITDEKVKLGKFLFHETALSMIPKLSIGEGSYSCASCHHVKAGFQAGIRQGIGEGGSGFGLAGEGRSKALNYHSDSLDVQPIRTPAALNVAYQQVMLWNGQFGATGPNVGTEAQWTAGTPKETNFLGYEGVETQAIAGLKVHRLMIDETYLDEFSYLTLFDAAFPDFPEHERYTNETAGLAIAAYERTLLASQSPFQMWLRGDDAALTNEELEGAILFFDKAKCVNCHTGPALNNMNFHALGMADLSGEGVHGVTIEDAEEAGKGRGGFTGINQDNYKFKTPQLYNLMVSPFYGHGGSFTNLEAVVAYKNKAIPENPNVSVFQLDPEFKALHLTSDEVKKIALFMEVSLYDPRLERYVPDMLLSGKCFPNADPKSMVDLGCN